MPLDALFLVWTFYFAHVVGDLSSLFLQNTSQNVIFVKVCVPFSIFNFVYIRKKLKFLDAAFIVMCLYAVVKWR